MVQGGPWDTLMISHGTRWPLGNFNELSWYKVPLGNFNELSEYKVPLGNFNELSWYKPQGGPWETLMSSHGTRWPLGNFNGLSWYKVAP